ncbi:MAG: hypothetical protein AAFR66_04530 [Bacteroidota bacterium]
MKLEIYTHYIHKLMYRLLLLATAISVASCGILKPQSSVPPRDLVAQNLISQGKTNMKEKRFRQAALMFEEASFRDFHQATTASVYLSGLAYFYAGDNYRALEKFETIIRDFSKSRYVEDAIYHRALIRVSSFDELEKITGLDNLLDQARFARDPGLARDADNAVKEHLFYRLKPDFLNRYYQQVDQQYRDIVLEALAYQLSETGRLAEAQGLVQQFQADGGKMNSFLEGFLSSSSAGFKEDDTYRIGVMLPLQLHEFTGSFSSEIPEDGKEALDFFEGFDLAIKDFESATGKKVFLKVLDTRGDTFEVKYRLRSLEVFYPDLIVGALDRAGQPDVTQMISAWTEERNIPMLIPYLPFQELIENKSNTFLAHPSIYTQGAMMAQFAFDSLGVRNSLIWTDLTKYTEQLSQGYSDKMLSLGGTSTRIEIIGDFREKDTREEIVEMVEQLSQEFFDSWYIPITSEEEKAGLILAELNRNPMNDSVKVLGSPQWYTRYNSIDRELKESFELHFTASSFLSTDENAYTDLYRKYLTGYAMPPNDWVIQGYDLGRYLANLIETHKGTEMSLKNHFMSAPKYDGLHIDYEFTNQFGNQCVNIGKFEDGGVRKVFTQCPPEVDPTALEDDFFKEEKE